MPSPLPVSHAALLTALDIPFVLVDPRGEILMAAPGSLTGFDMLEPGAREELIRKTTEPGAGILSRRVGEDLDVVAFPSIHEGRPCTCLLFTIGRSSVETELRREMREAEEASAAKSRFMANISHEIRTPLSGIIGFTEILLDSDPRPDQRVNIEILKESALSLLSIVNDILDLSRVEAGKLTLRQVPFSIRESVSSAVGRFSIQAEEKEISLWSGVEDDVPPVVLGDPDRLSQVLVNLLSNAVKFTERGDVEIRVSLTERAGNTAAILITVIDSGIGIPRDRLSELFVPFGRIEDTGPKRFAGAGLGLVISKTLAELMSGGLQVESKPGKGSVFRFSAVFGLPEAAATSRIEAAVEATNVSAPLDIILAEDNTINRTFITHFLEKAGHRITAVEDGRLLLEALDARSFDLVLLDIQMPVMDGAEALKAIRESGKPHADIPVIALTAYAMKGDRERFEAIGADGYVTKPVDLRLLDETIGRVLGGRRSVVETLAARYNGDVEVVGDVLGLFVKETPGKILDLERAVADVDFQRVGEVLHSLANAASVVRPGRIFERIRDIETALRSGKNVEWEREVPRLRADIESAVSMVSVELDRISGGVRGKA